jgi:hypothetical protein
LDFPWDPVCSPIRMVMDMKTSLATTISVVGVLAAGGVAFAVNTSVLDSATMTAENAPALQAEAIPVVNSNTSGSADSGSILSSLADSPSTPTTVVAGTDQPAVTTVAPSPTSSQTAYSVEGFGVVTLEQRESSLTIVSVVPQSSVTYSSKQESATRIEVSFMSSTGVSIKFHADVIDGRIVTSVMNEPRIQGAPRRKDDDHDSDEHEDRDEDHESGEHDDD